MIMVRFSSKCYIPSKLCRLGSQILPVKLERLCGLFARLNLGAGTNSTPFSLDLGQAQQQSYSLSTSTAAARGNIRLKTGSSVFSKRQSYSSETNFHVSKVLVVPKTTRYMFEKQRFGTEKTEDQLKQMLAERGSDWETIKERHRAHSENAEHVLNVLKKLQLDIRVLRRSQLNSDAVKWADLVISTGGDGTYLLAASKVFDETPVIGVNTDPKGSEGHLCLPNRYTPLFEDAMKQVLAGNFRWKRRQRIRITVDGSLVNKDPIDLHELELSFPEHYQRHCSQERRMLQGLDRLAPGPRVLPVLALNEIFIGESLSSRMSYYEMSVDDGPPEKQKSSGVTVSTGTGSSSWSFNINKLSTQSVRDILRIVNEETGTKIAMEESTVETIADRFNTSLLFDPDDPRMAYTVRDPVTNSVFHSEMPRGFARKIVIRSRCWDASLVIDAGSSFVFNDGAIATMEIHEEDALNTIQLLD